MPGKSKPSPRKATGGSAPAGGDPTSVQSPPKDSYTSLASLMDSPSRPRRGSASSASAAARTNHLDLADSGANSKLNVVPERREDASSDGGSSSAPSRAGRKGKTFAIGEHTERDAHDDRPDGEGYGSTQDDGKPKKFKKKKLTTWGMVALTASMGGGQLAWVVELGYGTPYLLSLGLSEQLTSLVWLAGPISGLIAQPLIGAISDSSLSRFRRRYWIVTSTILLVFAGLGLAFTEPIAEGLVSLFKGGLGDWDPERAKMVKSIAIAIAVTAFYCLDFALNALQGSLRNLVLDITPGEQLASANAWHGRFAHLANILGFALGSLNLAKFPLLNLLGGGQFRKFCVIAIVILVATVWVTCWTQEEEEREQELGVRKSKATDILHTIYEAIRHLPKPIRRVCYVQIFAFMGWFPYLFYSTTWVAEVMTIELGREPDVDDSTRAGSLAMLIYSFIAIAAGTLLPYLASRDRRLLAPETTEKGDHEHDNEIDQEEAELDKIREMVREWKLEAAREGKALRLPTMPFMLRNIWSSAMVLFFVLMVSTLFVDKVWQATVVIALVGICWAVACWVPFAIIMEFLKEIDDQQNAPQAESSNGRSRSQNRPPRQGPAAGVKARPLHSRALSTPMLWNAPDAPTERTGLIRSFSTADIDDLNEGVDYEGSKPAGGTIMGIHNLAIVFPQFLIALIASLIFKLSDAAASDGSGPVQGGNKSSHAVAHVLQFGGCMALVGALICRRVPPTKTEKAMRRRLAEMREEHESDDHLA